jgi:hypothetical protein
MAWTVARSISRPAKERLRQLAAGRSDVRVLAVFERACDLVAPDGSVVALVLPEIGDGPLNIVVDGAAGIFDGVEPGMPVTVEETRLETGGLRVDLEQATVWEPRPDWQTLRNRRTSIASRLPLLRTLCLRADTVRHHAPTGSLLVLLKDSPLPAGAVLSTARSAAEALRGGLTGNVEQLRQGAVGLAGLGSGLTPAGDDFLIGVMLWGWLAHPAPSLFCRTLANAAVPRTTTLSAAFLQAAAQGECSAPWHALLAALDGEPDTKIVAAVQDLFAHGATSGADSLAGFLYGKSKLLCNLRLP